MAALLTSERLSGRSKLRVVFLADCKRLAEDPVTTVHEALIAAFTDSAAASRELEQIASAHELHRFCSHQPPGTMLFMLDGCNSPALMLPRKSAPNATTAAMLFLRLCSGSQFCAEVTSRNDQNKTVIRKKRMSLAAHSLLGGLNTVRQHSFALTETHMRSGSNGSYAIAIA